MKKILMLVALFAIASAAVAQNAADEKFGRGLKLDRVFLIVLENHGYGQIISNTQT